MQQLHQRDFIFQIKLEKTYHAGRDQILVSANSPLAAATRRRASLLGVLRSSSYSLSRDAFQRRQTQRAAQNKTCQTILSFPSPRRRNSVVMRAVANAKVGLWKRWQRLTPRLLINRDAIHS